MVPAALAVIASTRKASTPTKPWFTGELGGELVQAVPTHVRHAPHDLADFPRLSLPLLASLLSALLDALRFDQLFRGRPERPCPFEVIPI